MSEHEPSGPYVYQPFGMQDGQHWDSGRLFGIGGLSHLATVHGLTRAEAERFVAAPEMLAALQASEREYANLEESAPVDAGCIECTAGTVPDRLNTGLCAHHLRVAAIALATKGRA